MKKLVLNDWEYEILQKLLRTVPPAQLSRHLPDCNGADIYFYRNLLTKVLHKDYRFPDTDDGMEEDAAWMYGTPDRHPDISEFDLEPLIEYEEG